MMAAIIHPSVTDIGSREGSFYNVPVVVDWWWLSHYYYYYYYYCSISHRDVITINIYNRQTEQSYRSRVMLMR